LHRSPARWAGRSSRREASLNRPVDSAYEPSVRLNEAAFAPARRSKSIFGVRSTGPERLLPSRRIHEGMDWGAAASKRKDRLQEASRQQTVTTANQENVARTALRAISKCEVVAGHPGRGFAAGFSRHDSGVQWCGKENGPQRPLITRGQMHHWRTVGPDIPRPVASPQSRIPFLRTPIVYYVLARFEARSTEKSGVQKIPRPKNRRQALDATGSFREDLWEPWAGNRPGPPGHH
jgi:hypothetical protein